MERFLQIYKGVRFIIIDEKHIKIQLDTCVFFQRSFDRNYYEYIKATSLRVNPRLENPIHIFSKIYKAYTLQKPTAGRENLKFHNVD